MCVYVTYVILVQTQTIPAWIASSITHREGGSIDLSSCNTDVQNTDNLIYMWPPGVLCVCLCFVYMWPVCVLFVCLCFVYMWPLGVLFACLCFVYMWPPGVLLVCLCFVYMWPLGVLFACLCFVYMWPPGVLFACLCFVYMWPLGVLFVCLCFVYKYSNINIARWLEALPLHSKSMRYLQQDQVSPPMFHRFAI